MLFLYVKFSESINQQEIWVFGYLSLSINHGASSAFSCVVYASYAFCLHCAYLNLFSLVGS